MNDSTLQELDAEISKLTLIQRQETHGKTLLRKRRALALAEVEKDEGIQAAREALGIAGAQYNRARARFAQTAHELNAANTAALDRYFAGESMETEAIERLEAERRFLDMALGAWQGRYAKWYRERIAEAEQTARRRFGVNDL